MTISTRLKQARLAKSWTQLDLESASGVKQGTISKIERGDQVATKFIVTLARSLDCSPGWLENGAKDDSDVDRIQGKLDKLTLSDLETIRDRLSDEQQKTIKTLLESWLPDELGK